MDETYSQARAESLEQWIAGFPETDGIRYLSSARSFGGTDVGEDDYAQQFTVGDDYIARLGEGIAHVLRLAEADFRHGALEIGCGTGIFTRGLITATKYAAYYISDMSPRFVEGTRRAVNRHAADKAVHYLVLSSEAFNVWPEQSLSLIALRYVLHHVLDWQEFIRHASRLLVPGGVLVIEEPCTDGYLLQVMLMKTLQAKLDQLTCSEQTRSEIDFFISTILWYLRTDVDKSDSEDKHLFQPTQLFALGQELGLRTRLYQNLGFDTVAAQQGPSRTYFEDEFRHNLKVNFGFGDETMELFETHLLPSCGLLQTVSGATNGPIVKGVFTFTKSH
jgi:SAM-dependent methyltransferase